eukprot:gene15546-18428_t
MARNTAQAPVRTVFPAHLRGILKGKQHVNLYMSNGVIVWQFAFNTMIIDAIKGLKGRKWDTTFANGKEKGRWTCPLESLPDAIALFEHMGRKPDTELKRRAKEVVENCGASATEGIRLVIHLQTADGSRSGDGLSYGIGESLGRVVAMFHYDADVVSAIKQLPPTQRSYDPATKSWPIDLLALPDLLEHLGALSYTPSTALSALASACAQIERLLEQPPCEPPTGDKPPSSGEPCSPLDGFESADDSEFDAALLSLDVDAIAASQGGSQGGSQGSREQMNNSQGGGVQIKQDAAEADFDAALIALDVDAIVAVHGCIQGCSQVSQGGGGAELSAKLEVAELRGPAGGSSSTSLEEREAELSATLKQLVKLACCNEGLGRVDTSDVGRAKKRLKLTSQQQKFLYGAHSDDGEDDNAYDYGDYDDEEVAYHKTGYNLMFDKLRRTLQGSARARTAPADCDCGQPWKQIGGRHCCRYFGYFQCITCRNRWTSAYCWKGERQACRKCNREVLPAKMERLDGRLGMGNGKPHDSARCSMCKDLGYDCSLN